MGLLFFKKNRGLYGVLLWFAMFFYYNGVISMALPYFYKVLSLLFASLLLCHYGYLIMALPPLGSPAPNDVGGVARSFPTQTAGQNTLDEDLLIWALAFEGFLPKDCGFSFLGEF